jgi:hypothetical protein
VERHELPVAQNPKSQFPNSKQIPNPNFQNSHPAGDRPKGEKPVLVIGISVIEYYLLFGACDLFVIWNLMLGIYLVFRFRMKLTFPAPPCAGAFRIVW